MSDNRYSVYRKPETLTRYDYLMSAPSLSALVLSHIGFEDLGTLHRPLLERGFTINTVEVAAQDFPFAEAQACDLLIVMGGPIGVYEQADYPFLKDEIVAIAARLRADRPTLGICLGAQLMAAALGARVYPGPNGKEIGWSPIRPAQGPVVPEWFKPLVAPGICVFHWHGDTFDLPRDATLLASSDGYVNQAFTYGSSTVGLQFHPEVTARDLQSWYVGHASELHQVGISVPALRAAARRHSPALEKAAQQAWNLWLDYIL